MASIDDEELERIKQRKMEEIQQRIAEEEARKRREAEKAAVMKVILTPEARQRLASLRLVRPELVANLENYLIQLAQAGRINAPVSDDELKRILDKLIPKKREIKIERRSSF